MKKKILLLLPAFCIVNILISSSAVAYSDQLMTQSFSAYDELNFWLENKARTSSRGPDWYEKPSSYAELVSWYLSLESAYPDYLEVFKANEHYGTGTVAGEYDLYYVRITNESLGLHKPEVLFCGSPHGDETVGTISLYWFTDWLMRMALTEETTTDFSQSYLRWILDHREIYLEVSHNPYGLDHGPRRYDYHWWDLNREADYDGPGPYTGGIWGSVAGKTLYHFVNDHLIRTGCDFHGGTRMLLYPWSSNHDDIYGTSPISGRSYSHAPPDFYFYDVSSLRLGDYIGDYGGDLTASKIGTIPDTVGYEAQGGIAPWAYGADVIENPVEDPFVEDETFGNYPGSGILWVSPEMSYIKNPSESTFGNDTDPGVGAEVRRFLLHQTDLAQPYVQWLTQTITDNATFRTGDLLHFEWIVNGSLVVDHTYMQYGTHPDPRMQYNNTTNDYDQYAGEYHGGTGWDYALDGTVTGISYNETIILNEPGDYYFTVAAQTDQIYQSVLRPDVYGNDPYLRIIKERTNPNYTESVMGADGLETIHGQLWWYAPILHATIRSNPPLTPLPPKGTTWGRTKLSYIYRAHTTDPDQNQIHYRWDWGDGTISDWEGPHNSNEITYTSHSWDTTGTHFVKVQSKDVYGEVSDWSDSLPVHIIIDGPYAASSIRVPIP